LFTQPKKKKGVRAEGQRKTAWHFRVVRQVRGMDDRRQRLHIFLDFFHFHFHFLHLSGRRQLIEGNERMAGIIGRSRNFNRSAGEKRSGFRRLLDEFLFGFPCQSPDALI